MTNAAKVRELISDLRRAGFGLDRQAGSHRQFKHSRFPGALTVSGREGDDAKPYQERQVRTAIQRVQNQ
ncbi:MAG TPA: type II toxin-antitoxin system HicA family toxin [Chthoniobacteraceae bacterium]|nr:type II toxin-antitoxin system HicA family toxin [Chthoniobacteraceae bacterium]